MMGRGAPALDNSFGLVPEGSKVGAVQVVRLKLDTLIQVLQKRGVILLAAVYVGEQEICLRGIGLPVKRLLSTFLSLRQAIQGE